MKRRYRILLLGSRAAWRSDVRRVIEACGGPFKIVGECPDGDAAREASRRWNTDLVLLDPRLLVEPLPLGMEFSGWAENLTPRECEVLALVADGRSNKEIAHRLGIGVRTVETHRERLMFKLDIRTAAGLTRFAISKGIVKLERRRP